MIKEHIKLFTGSGIIVNGLQFLLDAEKVNYIIKDKYESARLGGFGTYNQGTQELYVNKDELDAAIPIIESITSELQS